MSEVSGKQIIQSLQKKWNLQLLAAHLLLAAAMAVFLSAVAIKMLGINWIVSLGILLVLITVFYFLVLEKINEHDVAKFLNHTFPELQESTQLLLKPFDALNGLEKLQVKKIANVLNGHVLVPPLIKKKFTIACILLAAALLFMFLLSVIPAQPAHSSLPISTAGPAVFTSKPEVKLAAIQNVTVKISPPSYTGKSTRTQGLFNIEAEQNAIVNWNITTTGKASAVQFIFNDKSVLNLKPVNKEHTQWNAGKTIVQPGFYQVRIDKKLSELYKMDMIKDEAPAIIIQSPKLNTSIEYGEPKSVMLKVSVADDYGIANTSIQATVASGNGEAVKFKEQQFLFSNFKKGDRQCHLQKMIDLSALGMQPGDELYFYVKATDNHSQEKRSDVYIIRLEDTAQLMSMAGLVSGVDIKPEFFRSERQIIIETEQLLKDKDTISVEAFDKKSSGLGIDQKLLRLRYGKFLGEESETEIGDDHDHDAKDDHSDASDFSNADKILDQFTHKHDIAEDATFFDDATKKQLKATLDEMWKAELQLRTYKPKDALPFEYKALRLLKDLQQQTRSYVAKTGVKTTPLNPGKRLTGELTAVTQPANAENITQKDSSVITLRKAIGILEQLKNGEALQKKDVEILEQAGTQLSAKAASQPSIYLAAYQAFKRLPDKSANAGTIDVVGAAFQRMIQAVSGTPQQTGTSPDMDLSNRYFIHLKQQHDEVE